MKMYMVGGACRDEILGIPSKDIDFSVVLDEAEIGPRMAGGMTPYEVMVSNLGKMGVKIIRDKEGIPVGAEFVTARGIAPKNFPVHPGRALDFVLARKEGTYSDGRRPDIVEPGTLEDDLARRDFTMNAIAKDTDGNLIDPFNGVQAIKDRVIYAVGDPMERLTEDALRALRAVRFAVTKGFDIDGKLEAAMEHPDVLDAIRNKISDERIKDELSKMFRFNTSLAGEALWVWFPYLGDVCFSGSVSLDATMKTKGRGK